jgi:hypothetical protein
MKYPKRATSKATPFQDPSIMVDGYSDDEADEEQRCVITCVKTPV